MNLVISSEVTSVAIGGTGGGGDVQIGAGVSLSDAGGSVAILAGAGNRGGSVTLSAADGTEGPGGGMMIGSGGSGTGAGGNVGCRDDCPSSECRAGARRG